MKGAQDKWAVEQDIDETTIWDVDTHSVGLWACGDFAMIVRLIPEISD